MITVRKASEFGDSDLLCEKAHTFFYDVYYALPIEPISVLPRKKEHFKADQVLLATDEKNLILGMTILEPGPDFNKNMLVFHSNAMDVLTNKYTVKPQDLYMISSMVIDPRSRGQGIGSALYQKAKELSDNKCIGVLYQGNAPGRNLSLKSGFKEIATPMFSHRYFFKNKKHILDHQGDRVIYWNLFTSLEL